jgi:hypothetical protein
VFGVLELNQLVTLYDVLESAIAITPAVKQVAVADPTRVAIGFTCGTGGCLVSTLPTVSSTVGRVVNSTLPAAWYRWAECATLCQAAWYAISSAGTTLTMYQIFLRRNLTNEQPG